MSEIAETPTPGEAPAFAPADPETLRGAIGRGIQNLRSGDLGTLPIILALVIITIFFQNKNANFVSATNFVDIISEMAPPAIIGMGIVFVLLLGEIDLSIGYVSGVAGVIAALMLSDVFAPQLLVAHRRRHLAGRQRHLGLRRDRVRHPLRRGDRDAARHPHRQARAAVVRRDAGRLLAWSGVVLLLVASHGTIVIQNYVIFDVANKSLTDRLDWIFGIIVIVGYALTQLSRVLARARGTGLNAAILLVPLIRTLVMAVVVIGAVVIANKNTNGNGMPVVGVIMVALLALWSFVVSRTRFGRYVYAVGGNAEASRRAGINVDRIKILVFVICSSMAAIGGVVLASRSPRRTPARAAARSCSTRSPRRSSAAPTSSAAAATRAAPCWERRSSRASRLA